MNIPVFVSCPTDLSKPQEAARSKIIAFLSEEGFEPRSLGRGEYPTELPLREVIVIARRCSGGLILGFEQLRVESGIIKPKTSKELTISKPIPLPTPWNQLEAGILFSLRLPVLVFREDNIRGGVFDEGVSDVFLHSMPVLPLANKSKRALRMVFQKWAGKVREHYYNI